MAWLIAADEVPASWPDRCVGCGAEAPGGRVKAFGERLKSRVGVAHMFERLCVELPWCDRCASWARGLVLAGLGLIVAPWLLLTALSFEPSLRHLVDPQVLVWVAFGLNGLGLAALGGRYWLARPVRLLVSRQGVRGVVLRNGEVAAELAQRNGLTVKRGWRPRGW